MTSHAAQGQIVGKGAIVDLKIGGSSSTMSSYVAITRVERRKGLLIFHPSPRELFAQGQKLGLELLLKVWRREHIDWIAIEKTAYTTTMVSHMWNCKIQRMPWASAVGQATQARELQSVRHTPSRRGHTVGLQYVFGVDR